VLNTLIAANAAGEINDAELHNLLIFLFAAGYDTSKNMLTLIMHMMLQHPEPDDYVIATGETHTVREFCELAFSELGLDYREHVEIDPNLYRPAEVDTLIGDASKARKVLNWTTTRTFRDLVRDMVRSDLRLLETKHSTDPVTTAV